MTRPTHIGTSFAAAAVSVAIAACGSSSSPSSQSAATANGANGARRAEIAACLKKQGIKPPSGPRGNGPGGPPGGAGAPPPGGGLFGGGNGGNGGPGGNSQFRAALQKCGIRASGRGRGSVASTAAGRAALARFTTCVRKNGYALPAPNLSGSGPVFDPRKVNRNDPKFVAAVAKCQALIPRPTGPGGAGGPPPGA